MHSPLHAAECYLDPTLFGIQRHQDEEVMSGLYKAVDRMHPNESIATLIRSQIRAYKLQEGLFGTIATKRDKSLAAPTVWWEFNASGAPELQKFAIRILSKTSSASAC